MTYQWQWGVDQSTDRWCASWRRRNSSDVSSAVIAWRLGQPTRVAQKLHDEDATNLDVWCSLKSWSLPDVSILTLNKRNWYELQKQLTLWVFACALFTLGMFFLSQKLLKHLKLSAFASRQLPACQSIGCQQLPWQLTSSCERCPRRESQGPAHIQLRSKSNPWIGLSAKIKVYACHPQWSPVGKPEVNPQNPVGKSRKSSNSRHPIWANPSPTWDVASLGR